ncbi:ABC1 kinase family protein [Candidatus Magnetominusculus xianensis]|uniref:Ubiquinone biosynthesis protein UbiB n=1 Tax=Candidatus Magnetominusculus xianensis TaxID=1748249 RepID=A0ABR5SK33_9BACT|nr:AarF/ABC1/UbiB kinase family protein [Candidatus Magnetominusculus xianensis]KWT92937.1 putative ubiquinone biosynthesis protein UbiB [Candidatus Magnetominusculus xianensis]MBF0402941.1 AarF/ABC1/UbiB kinase family protein [Nitrospirota bacterium]
MFSELLKIRKTYRNINRITQILNVLVKHGFGQFIEQLNLYGLIPFRKRIKLLTGGVVLDNTVAASLRQVFEELGPSFIKLAQILSSRPDLITERYAQEFEKLQDEVPPFPYESAKEIIETELGRPIEEIFAEIEETPIAAASISQVHRATLKDGSIVVVKVQRPKIKETVETDISIMKMLSSLMLKYIPDTEIFNPLGIISEFSKTIKKELNFFEEAKNIERFSKNFKDGKTIKIPLLYPEFTSERVLVMERIEGIRISDINSIDRAGLDRDEIAAALVNAYFKMILDDGFFHADPHPGNLFVLYDGRIAIVDFGMAGWLTPVVMESIAALLIALVHKDFESLIDQFVELGMITDEMDVDRFRQDFLSDMMELLLPLYDSALAEINFAEYLNTVTHLAIKHKLKVPSSLLLIDKCLLIVDNTVRELAPTFNFITAAAPYTSTLMMKKYGPKRVFDKLERHLSGLADSLIDTPKKLRVLLRRMIAGDFTIKSQIAGIDRLTRDLEKSSNRLSFSIVIASIIMSSSILTLSGTGAKIFDIPAIGTLGFTIAFFLGIWLIISILRSGKL